MASPSRSAQCRSETPRERSDEQYCDHGPMRREREWARVWVRGKARRAGQIMAGTAYIVADQIQQKENQVQLNTFWSGGCEFIRLEPKLSGQWGCRRPLPAGLDSGTSRFGGQAAGAAGGSCSCFCGQHGRRQRLAGGVPSLKIPTCLSFLPGPLFCSFTPRWAAA